VLRISPFFHPEKDNNAWKSDIRKQYLTVMTFDTLGGSLKKTKRIILQLKPIQISVELKSAF